MTEMGLYKILIDEKKEDQIIILKEKGGKRLLPIVIGLIEANEVKRSVQGTLMARPLTHDLIQSVISFLGAQVKRAVVDKMIDSAFHAQLFLRPRDDDREVAVDGRPSDCISMALRSQAPIFVEEEVLRTKPS